MPCAVSQAELEYFERLHNNESYGVEWTNARLTTEAACAMAKLIDTHGLHHELPAFCIGWIANHKREDAQKT